MEETIKSSYFNLIKLLKIWQYFHDPVFILLAQFHEQIFIEWINWITKFEYKSIVYSMFIIVINNIN